MRGKEFELPEMGEAQLGSIFAKTIRIFDPHRHRLAAPFKIQRTCRRLLPYTIAAEFAPQWFRDTALRIEAMKYHRQR